MYLSPEPLVETSPPSFSQNSEATILVSIFAALVTWVFLKKTLLFLWPQIRATQKLTQANQALTIPLCRGI